MWPLWIQKRKPRVFFFEITSKEFAYSLREKWYSRKYGTEEAALSHHLYFFFFRSLFWKELSKVNFRCIKCLDAMLHKSCLKSARNTHQSSLGVQKAINGSIYLATRFSTFKSFSEFFTSSCNNLESRYDR